MKMELKVILVRAGEIPVPKTFVSFAEMLVALGITGKITWQTNLLNDGEGEFAGIGIIAHDQDKAGRRKVNLLGMRGHFAIIGMTRPNGNGEPEQINNSHMFESLTEDQIRMMQKKLARAMVFGGYRR